MGSDIKTTDKEDLIVGQSYWYVNLVQSSIDRGLPQMGPTYIFKAEYLGPNEEGHRFSLDCAIKGHVVTLHGKNDSPDRLNGVIYAQKINAIKRAKALTLESRKFTVETLREYNNVLASYRHELNEAKPRGNRRCWYCWGTGKRLTHD